MILDVPYKLLDIVPERELMGFDFGSITMERWARFTALRDNDFMFAETYTIPLRGPNPATREIVEMNTDLPLFPLIMNEVKKLERLYNATAIIVTLDGMPPGATIARHFDRGEAYVNYTKAHRCHLPLVTSWEVEFYIDDVAHYFEAGTFFEFDNQRYHEVKNKSNVFRIHLIVDLIPNKE